MAFDDKTIDSLHETHLAAWLNLLADADISQGSIIYIFGGVLAADLFGIYQDQANIANDTFPDTAALNVLIRRAAQRGVIQNPGETNADFRNRFLAFLRQPPAGGNKLDYQNEALSVAGVAVAKIFGPEDGQARGKVAIIILTSATTGVTDATEANKLHDAGGGLVAGMVGAIATNTDDDTTAEITAFVDSGELTLDADIFVSGQNYSIASVIPSTVLVASVQTAIDDFKPVGAEATVSGAAVASTEDITMTVTGQDADKAAIAIDVAAYVNGLDIGESLLRNQLIAIAMNNEATGVTITAPASDVTPSQTEIILLGTVTIS